MLATARKHKRANCLVPLARMYDWGVAKREKDPAAVSLGKLRAAQMTPEERSAAGLARAKALTAAQRKAIAKKGAAARWGKKATKKAAKKKPK